MPVISSKALVSTFDSYSCVGMVSDSTLISIPLNGSAAFTNHSSSFNWSSFDSVVGWNSLSAHFFAASASAKAGAAPSASSNAAADTVLKSDIAQSSHCACGLAKGPERMLIRLSSSPRSTFADLIVRFLVHIGVERRLLGRRQMQTELGASPKYVFRGTRPFFLDEVIDFTRTQRPKTLAKILGRTD